MNLCGQVLKAELEDQEKSLKAAVALQENAPGFNHSVVDSV